MTTRPSPPASFTPESYKAWYGIKSHANSPRRQLPHAKPKPDKGGALERQLSEQEGGIQRTRVCFIGHRVRPLDPDNFAGSVKELLDGLRHAHLVDGDEPWRIKLETGQVKVSHYFEEKTIITIDYPDNQTTTDTSNT